MLQFMLCGAHDVGELSEAFTDIAQDFGAEPWFYQMGRVHHINSATSRWAENSRATVQKADVCVFVMLERYGDITWTHELQEALTLGKPFVVLALESAWIRYTNLLHSLSDAEAIKSADDQRMVELLRMISSDYQLTVTPFTYHTFKEKLRAELAQLFSEGTKLVESRNRRGALLEMLTGAAMLNREQVNQLIALATDEYESNKLGRKAALKRLAAQGVRDDELLLETCRSQEQGVQRLAFDLFPRLIAVPPDEDVLRELAQIAGKTDDVGVARRFIAGVTQMDPALLDTVFEAIGSMEEGLRRRAFEGIEQSLDDVLEKWGADRMRNFLDLCEAKTPARAAWMERLRQVRASLD